MKSSALHKILDHHYAKHIRGPGDPVLNSTEWFPAEHQNSGDNYLVPPDIVAEIIPATDDVRLRRVFLSISLDADWEVSQETWTAFSWNPRIVYVGSLENIAGVNVAAFRRTLAPFAKHPKPTWENLLEWERNYTLALSLIPYRAAWTSIDESGIPVIDLAQGRELHRDVIRRQRATAWVEADAAWFRAMDDDDETAICAAARVRRRMRDAPAHASIAGAATVDALRQITLASILASAP